MSGNNGLPANVTTLHTPNLQTVPAPTIKTTARTGLFKMLHTAKSRIGWNKKEVSENIISDDSDVSEFKQIKSQFANFLVKFKEENHSLISKIEAYIKEKGEHKNEIINFPMEYEFEGQILAFGINFEQNNKLKLQSILIEKFDNSHLSFGNTDIICEQMTEKGFKFDYPFDKSITSEYGQNKDIIKKIAAFLSTDEGMCFVSKQLDLMFKVKYK